MLSFRSHKLQIRLACRLITDKFLQSIGRHVHVGPTTLSGGVGVDTGPLATHTEDYSYKSLSVMFLGVETKNLRRDSSKIVSRMSLVNIDKYTHRSGPTYIEARTAFSAV